MLAINTICSPLMDHMIRMSACMTDAVYSKG